MPFIFKKSRNPNGGRELVSDWVLTDSATFTVGDAVELNSSGLLALAGAGAVFVGVIEGFKKADGSPVTDNGAGGDFVGTYTTPASNTVKATIDVSINSIYSVTADATLGTTTGSDLAGYNMDMLAASDQLDESTAVTTTAQWFSHGTDPDGSAASNSVLVSIQESQIKI